MFMIPFKIIFLKDLPEIGDYVILDHEWFYENKIGKVLNIINKKLEFNGYKTKYYIRIILENRKHYVEVDKKDIKYWSKNKEDLETILIQQKYNL